MPKLLIQAAHDYFIDPTAFLMALRLDANAALAKLAADPKSFGLTRSYIGKAATAKALATLRSTIRNQAVNQTESQPT